MTQTPDFTAWTASPLFLWEGAGQAMSAHLAQMQSQDQQIGGAIQKFLAGLNLKTGAGDPRKPPPKSVAPTFLDYATRHDGGFFVADRVAYITVNGPLERKEGWYGVGYDGLTRRVETALGDSAIEGVFLSIDSPGGHAAGMLECAARLRAASDEAGKPLVAHAPALVASAAYGLSVAADRLTIDADAMCGSVGVVLLHLELSKMLESFGVQLTAIQFGEKKTDGNFWEPLSDRARSDLQTMINDMGARFVAHVSDRRGLASEAVIDWQAGILVGQRALDASMADGLATEGEAFASLVADVSPTPTTFSPAGAGADTHAPTPETQQRKADMSLKADIDAVLEGDGTADDKLAAVTALAEAAEDDSAETEVEDDPSKAEESDVEEEEGADEESDDDTPDASTAGQIVTLPEAKGKAKTAVDLANTPGMTVKAAKSLLAKAPKDKAGSSLADRMEGQDPDISGSAPTSTDNPLLGAIPQRSSKR